MASSTLSSLRVSVPFSSQRSSNGVNPSSARFVPLRRNFSNNSIHAMVTGEGRDNLDHLQRSTRPQQQGQPRKKVPQVAPIGLWEGVPNGNRVQQMLDTMERLMEDPLAYSNTWNSPLTRQDVAAPDYRKGGTTRWEMKELDNAYKLRFWMPGMTRNDVKVWVEEKMLVVQAEKVVKKKEGGENGAAVEDDGEEWSAKSYGKYSSRIALPENVEFEKIKAEVRDGVLYISIPKVSVSSKVVDINVQ